MEYLAQISGFINNFPFFTAIIAAFFLLYWTNVFFLVYHLTRFGIGPVPKLFALIFLLGSILFFSLAMLAYSRVDFALIWEAIKANSSMPDGVPIFRLPSFSVPPLTSPTLQ